MGRSGTYPKVIVSRITLGLPVPVMRGILADVVRLRCLIVGAERQLGNRRGEQRGLESIRLNMEMEVRRYRS